jgi:hypothetical protein
MYLFRKQGTLKLVDSRRAMKVSDSPCYGSSRFDGTCVSEPFLLGFKQYGLTIPEQRKSGDIFRYVLLERTGFRDIGILPAGYAQNDIYFFIEPTPSPRHVSLWPLKVEMLHWPNDNDQGHFHGVSYNQTMGRYVLPKALREHLRKIQGQTEVTE